MLTDLHHPIYLSVLIPLIFSKYVPVQMYFLNIILTMTPLALIPFAQLRICEMLVPQIIITTIITIRFTAYKQSIWSEVLILAKHCCLFLINPVFEN